MFKKLNTLSLAAIVFMAQMVLNAEIIELTKENFQKVIDSATKPVIIDYYADWCQPCKNIAPIYQKLSENLKDKYIFTKAKFEENQDAVKAHNIMALPSFVVIKDKQVLGKISGAQTYQDLEKRIEEILNPQNLSTLSKEEINEKFKNAICSYSYEEIPSLIKAGADINTQVQPNMPAIFMVITACGTGIVQSATSTLRLLLDAGAKLDYIPANSEKPITLSELSQQTINALNQSIERYKSAISILKEYEAKNK